MKLMFFFLSAIGLVAAGVAGQWLGIEIFKTFAIWFLGGGLVMLCSAALRVTYYRSGYNWSAASNQPKPLRLRLLDYIKAFVCWLNAFKRTYTIEPGIYYTGDHYDRNAPLLVTSNYFLTVFLVIRRISRLNVRLLVIDTDGINVWCSASEGQFSHTEILKQLNRYESSLLTDDQRLVMILPKLSLAGVNLHALRRANIRPVIGPIYAKDLLLYLSRTPFKDCNQDRVIFGLQSRLYTWMPGLVQVLGYGFAVLLFFWGIEQIWGLQVPIGIIYLTGVLATAYPILFPWIPGVRFAAKGLWVAAFTSLGICTLTTFGVLSLKDLPMTLFFTFGTAVFFSLSYTGNSAVSNYSRVRREIARFLPLYVSLHAASLVAFVITEVSR